MLDQNMKEVQVGEVDIVDVDPDTFKQVLEFIYTGQVAIHMVLIFLKLFLHNRWEMKTTLQSFCTLETSMDLTVW